eukprot:903803-Prorocentrum_minimum.AAC.1
MFYVSCWYHRWQGPTRSQPYIGKHTASLSASARAGAHLHGIGELAVRLIVEGARCLEVDLRHAQEPCLRPPTARHRAPSERAGQRN